MTVASNEATIRKTFESKHALKFPCIWNEETISFVVSLDTTVIIDILQEIIRILHEKILKAVNLYWFKNDASEKTYSLNGHFNKPWING